MAEVNRGWKKYMLSFSEDILLTSYFYPHQLTFVIFKANLKKKMHMFIQTFEMCFVCMERVTVLVLIESDTPFKVLQVKELAPLSPV